MGEIPSTELRSRASGREKSLQQSPVSEWEKSHSGVSWRDVGEPALPLPSEGNPILGRALEVVWMNIQAQNETLNKILNVDVGSGVLVRSSDLGND